MLSVVDPTGRRAGFHAVVAAAALVPISVAPAWALPGIAGGIYAVLALVLSLGQLGCACAFRIQLTDQAARRLLRCSLVYLPLLLLLQVSIPWQH
jgi:protoheme IX farnesyltransferase